MVELEACYTCRHRRVQCDRSGIPCGKCVKSGFECHQKRPIRWVKGVAIRGKMQGVSYSRLNNPAGDEQGLIKLRRRGQQGLPIGLGDASMSSLDRVSKFYLDYLKDPLLLSTVLALAARHRANEGQTFNGMEAPVPWTDNAQHNALVFKHQAIHGLSQIVGDPESCRSDPTIASIFLLIFLDLVESGNDRWNAHLEGAKALLSLNKSLSQVHDPGQTVQEIRSFITKQIYLIETLGGTFVRPNLLSNFPAEDKVKMGPDMVEQSFLGCPEQLLNAVQFFSSQRDLATAGQASEVCIRNTSFMIKSVHSFHGYSWAANLRQSTVYATHNLATLAECYKLGALIYGRRVLDMLSGRDTSQEEVVQNLFATIETLKRDAALFKCLLWPIFVAGLECRSSSEREFVIRALERFWTITLCLNTVNAGKILQSHWQTQDGNKDKSSNWVLGIGQLGEDWLLI
ncbi:Zn(II)2Cys6 transcription factor [Aspergillus fumigatus Af293]|uniref:C6 transcription factor (Acr-2), putative n=1 Tax=Aspergillus fumigatus (strain ATCC MYA-4609 / CBS 101355 / FGSC A1100 / Af293) TaxID=330879 RepID=Q4WVY9_ASPFU|nr:C6 transcription factor (Acr-2), putative [Aspergillus fumigatus Af293]EAL91237.1 C6 transcription factor (Acr-2), putative [Aspergillus fumigatus Af293]